MSGRPHGPYTVKKRRPVVGRPKRLRVGVGEELVRLLGRGVERERVVHVMVDRERHRRVGAVDRARARVGEVLAAVVAAAFEDVLEADDVGLDVGVRVRDRVADAGLGGEVDDAREAVLGEELVHRRTVREVDLHEA